MRIFWLYYLLMGGGEGMGPIEATAQALGNALCDENHGVPRGQMLVICGRNKKLVSKLSFLDWKIPVQVKGFVTKMEEAMGACDCIITKAGPGTIAEAMIRGLPIILNGYIAGQEAWNVPHVVENGCGRFSKSPKEIAKIVADWFRPKSEELKICLRMHLGWRDRRRCSKYFMIFTNSSDNETVFPSSPAQHSPPPLRLLLH